MPSLPPAIPPVCENCRLDAHSINTLLKYRTVFCMAEYWQLRQYYYTGRWRRSQCSDDHDDERRSRSPRSRRRSPTTGVLLVLRCVSSAVKESLWRFSVIQRGNFTVPYVTFEYHLKRPKPRIFLGQYQYYCQCPYNCAMRFSVLVLSPGTRSGVLLNYLGRVSEYSRQDICAWIVTVYASRSSKRWILVPSVP